MAPEHGGEEPSGYGTSPHMKTVALSILVMGVSIALVIVIWVWFGYIGPSFSSNRLLDQQEELRQDYGLPSQPPVPKELLETPPSLRNLGESVGSTNTTSATSPASTASASTNETSANATSVNQTAAVASSGGTEVSIVQGAASKTEDAFDPNPAEANAGDIVTWSNGDSVPHTVTSGQDAKPDGTFDSGILANGQSFSFTFEKAGDYQYYCMLHPNMVGMITVS